MTEPDVRRKRALLRAWRRGSLEMDLLVGSEGEAWLARGGDLAALDRLTTSDDADIRDWIDGVAEPPEECRALVAQLRVRWQGGAG